MFNKKPDPKKKQGGTVILTNDPNTGKPMTGNGRPLTREQERKLLEQGGTWDGGEYTTYDPQWS